MNCRRRARAGWRTRPVGVNADGEHTLGVVCEQSSGVVCEHTSSVVRCTGVGLTGRRPDSDGGLPFVRAAGRLTQPKTAYFALKTSKAAEVGPGRLIVNEARQTALGDSFQVDTIGLGKGHPVPDTR